MLRGVDPLLSGELLKVLDEMGHGDQLLLVDRNFPAASSGRPVVRLQVGVEHAAAAILSVFPLDAFVDHPLERMIAQDDPSIVLPHHERVLELAQAHHTAALEFGVVDRSDFYERATRVVAVVHTLEAEPYGCFILQKGVVFPEGVRDDGR